MVGEDWKGFRPMIEKTIFFSNEWGKGSVWDYIETKGLLDMYLCKWLLPTALWWEEVLYS